MSLLHTKNQNPSLNGWQIHLRRGKVERTLLPPGPAWYKHCMCYESQSQYVGQRLRSVGLHLFTQNSCLPLKKKNQ